ncbi:MAG: hypothetical protein WB683_10100 [Candidatus Sulfotelmatobacter sp.]
MEYIDGISLALTFSVAFHIPEYRIENVKTLRPQDVIVILKLVANNNQANWTYSELSKALSMSTSQVFRSVARAEAAHLLTVPPLPIGKVEGISLFARPNLGNLTEFLVHGVKYCFPVERGAITRGVPTAHAASPLNQHIVQSSELPPVWPFADGRVRGNALLPLYKNAPEAALRDPRLYELLALVDAIRDGRAREREIAVQELSRRIKAK